MHQHVPRTNLESAQRDAQRPQSAGNHVSAGGFPVSTHSVAQEEDYDDLADDSPMEDEPPPDSNPQLDLAQLRRAQSHHPHQRPNVSSQNDPPLSQHLRQAKKRPPDESEPSDPNKLTSQQSLPSRSTSSPPGSRSGRSTIFSRSGQSFTSRTQSRTMDDDNMTVTNAASPKVLYVTTHGTVRELEDGSPRGVYAVVAPAHLVKIALPLSGTVHTQQRASLGALYAALELVHGLRTRNAIIYLTDSRVVRMFNNRLDSWAASGCSNERRTESTIVNEHDQLSDEDDQDDDGYGDLNDQDDEDDAEQDEDEVMMSRDQRPWAAILKLRNALHGRGANISVRRARRYARDTRVVFRLARHAVLQRSNQSEPYGGSNPDGYTHLAEVGQSLGSESAAARARAMELEREICKDLNGGCNVTLPQLPPQSTLLCPPRRESKERRFRMKETMMRYPYRRHAHQSQPKCPTVTPQCTLVIEHPKNVHDGEPPLECRRRHRRHRHKQKNNEEPPQEHCRRHCRRVRRHRHCPRRQHEHDTQPQARRSCGPSVMAGGSCPRRHRERDAKASMRRSCGAPGMGMGDGVELCRRPGTGGRMRTTEMPRLECPYRYEEPSCAVPARSRNKCKRPAQHSDFRRSLLSEELAELRFLQSGHGGTHLDDDDDDDDKTVRTTVQTVLDASASRSDAQSVSMSRYAAAERVRSVTRSSQSKSKRNSREGKGPVRIRPSSLYSDSDSETEDEDVVLDDDEEDDLHHHHHHHHDAPTNQSFINDDDDDDMSINRKSALSGLPFMPREQYPWFGNDHGSYYPFVPFPQQQGRPQAQGHGTEQPAASARVQAQPHVPVQAQEQGQMQSGNGAIMADLERRSA